MSDMRKQFENWASAPPREFDVERFDEDHDSWPGSYRSYRVQCAWEAWQAAQEDGLVADLKRQLAKARKLQVRLYNTGYELGHHDTVEGVFCPIHMSDIDTMHADLVDDVVAAEGGKDE